MSCASASWVANFAAQRVGKRYTPGQRGTPVAFGAANACSTGFGYAPLHRSAFGAGLKRYMEQESSW